MGDLKLIFNGDDLGRALSVNAAIVWAHREGVLTSASLMVTGSAAADAATRVRECPGLAVGLHLALAGARGALPACQVPHLLDASGQLPADPVAAGLACFFSPVVRSELRREIIAQFERFLDTGLAPSHVDGHYLIHLHPTVLSIVVPLAEAYGFHGIRVPRDDLRLALRLDRGRMAVKATWAAIYALLCRLGGQRLRRSTLAFTDRVYGLLQTGRMHEAFVARLLARIPPSVRSAELYFHPSTEPGDEPYGPNPGDLAALLSPRIREAVRTRGATLTDYTALTAGSQRRVVCPGR
jgi:hopanoid biosynthesis associated protein HpnK